MVKQFILVTLFFISSIHGGTTFSPPSGFTNQDIQRIMTFFTAQGNVKGDGTLGTIGTSCGVSYIGANNLLPGNTYLPLSFYSSPAYWQYYVGQNSSTYLNVTDIYNTPNGSYNLVPTPACSTTAPFPVLLCPGNLQIERLNAFNGTNIYDAAVWQIALALGGKNGFVGPSSTSLFTILNGENLLLQQGTYGGNYGGSSSAGVLRALTQGSLFTYGLTHHVVSANPSINNANAYMYRAIPPNFISADPIYFLSGTQFIASDISNPFPLPLPYFLGAVTWQDFKPITGENGWGLLVGPLQSALLEQQSTQALFVPFSSASVQNALNVLPTFQAMQSTIGACYYVANGSLGNISEVNPYTISLENNFSLLGGLFALKRILNDQLSYETTLSQNDKVTINNSLQIIQTMIYGGLSYGIQTEGILAFLKNYGWDNSNKIFYTAGLANDPSQSAVWVPDTSATAVDVQTWGLSCLGVPLVDSWFGFGTSYNIWQTVKSYGGFYGPDGTLWGVGYSNKDGNGSPGSYVNGINSGEWTAGAINMVRALISQYGTIATLSSNYSVDQRNQALAYVASLQADEVSMKNGLLTLSTDQYPTNAAYTSFVPTVTSPSNMSYNEILFNSATPPSDRLAFVYASKRYAIPFGWNSNPIPSVASTGWVVFNYYNFNPFNPMGTYDANPELNIIPPVPKFSVEYINSVKQEKVDQVKKLLE